MVRLQNLRVPMWCGLTTVLALLSACETPTAIEELELDELALHKGKGGVVTRSEDRNLLLATADPESGLLTAHYPNVTVFTQVTGCDAPAFDEALQVVTIEYPDGSTRIHARGKVFVRVYDLAGFPANVCEEPLAQGQVRIRGALKSEGPNAPPVGNFISGGTITMSAVGKEHGERIRLRTRTVLDGSGAFPLPGTIRLGHRNGHHH